MLAVLTMVCVNLIILYISNIVLDKVIRRNDAFTLGLTVGALIMILDYVILNTF